jgi:transketolase
VARSIPTIARLETAEKKAIRDAYGEALVELGAENKDIVVLETDVGSSTRSILFGKAYPEKYFNVGIAEGNMMAIAAGLASCGKIPFVNTFAVFATLRAGDPLRNLVCLANLNVKVAAAYGGLSDSYDGATHQSVEDIAIARALPNVTVVVPTDAVETKAAVQAVARHKGPVFLRLGRAPVPILFAETPEFKIGEGVVLRPGRDFTLVACGYMVHKALEATEILVNDGFDPRVIAMPTIKPLDTELLLEAAIETGRIVTIEEHNIYGGLGSAVAEYLVQTRPVPMNIIGIPDRYGESGDYEELLRKMGLDGRSIAKQIYRFLSNRGE